MVVVLFCFVLLVCSVDNARSTVATPYSDLTDLNLGNKPIGSAREVYSAVQYVPCLELPSHPQLEEAPGSSESVQCQVEGP
jgi:hypothetical protein